MLSTLGKNLIGYVMVRCDTLSDVIHLSQCSRGLYVVFRNHPEFEEIQWCIGTRNWKRLGQIAIKRDDVRTIRTLWFNTLIKPDGRTRIIVEKQSRLVCSFKWDSLFFYALKYGSVRMCRILWEKRDPHQLSERKEARIFRQACIGANRDVIEWVTDLGWWDWNAAYEAACTNNDPKLMELAKSRGGYELKCHYTWACATGNLALVRTLMTDPSLQPDPTAPTQLVSARNGNPFTFERFSYIHGIYVTIRPKQYEVFQFLIPKVSREKHFQIACNMAHCDHLSWLQEFVSTWRVDLHSPNILIWAAKSETPSRCLRWLLETFPWLRLKELPKDVFIPRCNMRVLQQHHDFH